MGQSLASHKAGVIVTDRHICFDARTIFSEANSKNGGDAWLASALGNPKEAQDVYIFTGFVCFMEPTRSVCVCANGRDFPMYLWQGEARPSDSDEDADSAVDTTCAP